MEAMTIQRYIHRSPRKLRLVADMVKKLDPINSLTILKFTKKDAAVDLSAAIGTAIANAKQKGMEAVAFKSIEINEGPKMKRFRPGTKGRIKRYTKDMSHIKIVLTDEITEKTKVSSQKLEKNIKDIDIEIGKETK